MPNLNFYDRDGTLRSLPLTAIETTAYADFHKRSETTYPDLSITAGFSLFLFPTLKNFIAEFGGPKGSRTPLSRMKTTCPNR